MTIVSKSISACALQRFALALLAATLASCGAEVAGTAAGVAAAEAAQASQARAQQAKIIDGIKQAEALAAARTASAADEAGR